MIRNELFIYKSGGKRQGNCIHKNCKQTGKKYKAWIILLIPQVQRFDSWSWSFVNCSRFVIGITWSQTRISRNAAMRRLFLSKVYLFTWNGCVGIFTPNMMDATVTDCLLKLHVWKCLFLLKDKFGCGHGCSTKVKTADMERIMCATVLTFKKKHIDEKGFHSLIFVFVWAFRKL